MQSRGGVLGHALSLVRVVSLNGVRISLGLWPFATYMPEYYEIKKTGREGLRSWTCLIAAEVGILRLAFWIVRRVRAVSYATYSIALVLVQLMLLDAFVIMRKEVCPPTSQGKRQGSAQLAWHSRKLVRACLSGRHETVRELWRKLSTSFWNWDELDPYVEVLVVSALAIIIISVFSVRIGSRDGYIRSLELILGFLEACIPLPHLVTQCATFLCMRSQPPARRYRHIHGTTLICWCCRDAYIFLTCQPEGLPTLGSPQSRGSKFLRTVAAFRLCADGLVLLARLLISYEPYQLLREEDNDQNGSTKTRRTYRAKFFSFLSKRRAHPQPSLQLTTPKFQDSQDLEALLDHTNGHSNNLHEKDEHTHSKDHLSPAHGSSTPMNSPNLISTSTNGHGQCFAAAAAMDPQTSTATSAPAGSVSIKKKSANSPVSSTAAGRPQSLSGTFPS